MERQGADTQHGTPHDEDHGHLLADISNAMVRLHKEFYGKGPDKAKTYYHGDAILVLMRGGFTRVEQTLVSAGRGADVVEQRSAFQEVMQGRFREEIERLTGRKVIGFMSGSQQEPDMIAEIFVLEPSDLIA